MEESIILVDKDGEYFGTVSNPIMCVVASPDEGE
jgi:hypothetical protein